MTGRWIRMFYYFVKPALPRALQIFLRSRVARAQRSRVSSQVWPILLGSEKKPASWKGWPDGRQFALVLTHDVEGKRGLARCSRLMELERSKGFRSAFNFVPGDYVVPAALRLLLMENGFEVGVHGLHHDGRMYQSRQVFASHAVRINEVLKEWKSVGFRTPSMYHNLDWLHSLRIDYDCSTFDTDPFEPQSDGVGTIFPFWIQGAEGEGYVELPYTLPQDLTLFVLLRESSNRIWKEKLDWIAANGGMALVNTHPDYLFPGTGKMRVDEYPMEHYLDFLDYISLTYRDRVWQALPREVARFARTVFAPPSHPTTTDREEDGTAAATT